MKRRVGGYALCSFLAALSLLSQPLVAPIPVSGPRGLSSRGSQTADQKAQSGLLASEVQAGVAALKQGDFPTAEEHFKAALKIDPDLAEVRANLGLAYYAGHQYEQAILNFREALKQNSNLQTAKSLLPLSLAEAGDCREAMAGLSYEFDSAANKKLQRVAGLTLLRCQMQAGTDVSATRTATKLLANDPDDPDVLYATGQLYTRLSNVIYLRLMKVAPHSAQTYQLMGSVAAAEGNWKGAINAYRRALQVDPGLHGAHLQIAILLLIHSPDPNAWLEALKDLHAELRVDPASAEAEYEIGEAYRKHAQPLKAIPALERSLKLDPGAVPVRISLAQCFRDTGRGAEAVSVLKPAEQSHSNDPSVHFLLAQIYNAMGEKSLAEREQAAFERLQNRNAAPPL